MGFTKVQLTEKGPLYVLLIHEGSSNPLYQMCFSNAGRKPGEPTALEAARKEGERIAKYSNIQLEEVL